MLASASACSRNHSPVAFALNAKKTDYQNGRLSNRSCHLWPVVVSVNREVTSRPSSRGTPNHHGNDFPCMLLEACTEATSTHHP